MSKGVNKVILIGNLGADPESVGGAVKMKLATSETWKDKQTGQNTERTEWHQVTLFSRLGEIAKQYLSKGSKVYIEGSIRTSKYQGKDGSDKYNTEIIASNLQMLDSKSNDKPSSQPMTSFKKAEHNYMPATDDLDDLPF